MSSATPVRAGFEREGTELCKETIAHHSKSFSMASRLFSRETSEQAAIVYNWCRRADDAIDETPREQQGAALARLHSELDAIYGSEMVGEADLAAFQRVVCARALPRLYCDELLLGMQMDCEDQRYETLDDLLLYCHRVAGVVGLMMCHVMGLREANARKNAVHLGMAMQLTNICRDVLEDWARGRLYVPQEMLTANGAPILEPEPGKAWPMEADKPMKSAVGELLTIAEEFYRSGDQGLMALPWRCALAVRSARRIYSTIGKRIQRQDCDVTLGRAYVSKSHKLRLVSSALAASLFEAPRRLFAAEKSYDALRSCPPLKYPDDILPLRSETTADMVPSS